MFSYSGNINFIKASKLEQSTEKREEFPFNIYWLSEERQIVQENLPVSCIIN